MSLPHLRYHLIVGKERLTRLGVDEVKPKGWFNPIRTAAFLRHYLPPESLMCQAVQISIMKRPGMDYSKISVLKMIVLALGTYNFYIRPNLSQLKLFKQGYPSNERLKKSLGCTIVPPAV